LQKKIAKTIIMKIISILAISFMFLTKCVNPASIFAHRERQLTNYEDANSQSEVLSEPSPFIPPSNSGPIVKLIETLMKETRTFDEEDVSEDQNWQQILTDENYSDFKTVPDQIVFRQHWSNRFMPGGKRNSLKESHEAISEHPDSSSELGVQDPLNPYETPERRQHWSFDLYPGGKR